MRVLWMCVICGRDIPFIMSFSYVVIMSMMCVSVYDVKVIIPFIFPPPPPPPQSVDDFPVVSDKGRARGEHGVKNGIKFIS